MPWFAWTLANRRMFIEPTSQAANAVPMNSRILVRAKGTPTARELSAEPPTAKIQLPNLVRTRIQAAIAVTPIHQMIDTGNAWPLMSNVDANTLPADS